MAGKEESETTIVINQADLEDGYFVFGTSIPSHFQRLCKKIGKDNIQTKESTKDGVVTYWDCRIPSKYLAKGSFCVKKPRKIRQPISSEAKTLLIARLAKNRGK